MELFLVLNQSYFVFHLPAGMVDVVFADVAQPDQARIVAINAHHFLKNQGHFVISIKASYQYNYYYCFDSISPTYYIATYKISRDLIFMVLQLTVTSIKF